MIRWLAALWLAVAAPALATPEPVADVTVARDGKSWAADYRLLERAPVWVFPESVLPRESRKSWRIGTVRVLTPGVALQRRGKFDALVATNGGPVPQKVRVRLVPFTKHLEADYVPALRLGGDSVARRQSGMSSGSRMYTSSPSGDAISSWKNCPRLRCCGSTRRSNSPS